MKIRACDITVSLMSWVARARAEIVVPNYYIGTWECDVLKVSTSGHLYEYEVKVSRADFKADFNKTMGSVRYGTLTSKHDILLQGKRVNRFYYVVPEGLIDHAEVPGQCGLIYATPYEYTPRYGKPYIRYTFRIVKVAKQLSKDALCTTRMYQHLALNLSMKLISAKFRGRKG